MYGVPWDSDQLRAYLTVLAYTGASDDRLARGVFAACVTCKFMPKPADIIEHMPQHVPTQTMIGTDGAITPEERAFNAAAMSLLTRYANKELSRDEYLVRLLWEAKAAGVEMMVNWSDFGDDTPWSNNGGEV